MSNKDVNVIHVHSWPLLWIYWPMYVALGRVLEERKKLGSPISFERVPPPDTTTDKLIREAFDNERLSTFCLALCEPPPDLKKVRKIPLVLRQPHWLLAPKSLCFPENAPYAVTKGIRSFHMPAKELAQLMGNDLVLYCYADNTTSGTFVRNFIEPLLRQEPYSVPNITIRELGNTDRFQNELLLQHAPQCALQATFTPWHLEPAAGAISLAEYASPVRDITALLVPESGDDSGLFEDVLENLNRILAQLFETQGVDHKVKKLLEHYRDPIREFFHEYPPRSGNDRQSGAPYDADTYDESLSRKLACYIRRGCYFPYRMILDSIQPELVRMFKEEAEDALTRAAIGFKTNLNLFFGTPLSWAELSISARRSVQVRWHLTGTENDKPLWNKIKHWREEQNGIAWPHLVAQIRVMLADNEIPQPLDLLRREGRDVLCQGVSHRDPDECNQKGIACFLCHIGGYPYTILRQARCLLLEKVKSKLPREKPIPSDDLLVGHKVTGVASHGSLLCWEDIKGLIDTFCDEMQTPTVHESVPPCFVCVHNEVVNVQDVSNKVLVTVFWRDEPKSGTGYGGKDSAAGRLHTWAGRLINTLPLTSCYLWFGSGDANQDKWRQIWPTLEQNATASESPASLAQLWTSQEAVTIRTGYRFAYVALFDTSRGSST